MNAPMTAEQPATERVLAGWRVLVTRPQHTADTLMARLQAAGAQAVHVPVLRIEALPETAGMRALAQDLDRCHAVIFTSRHAVQYGAALLARWWPQWPVGLHWLAVGSTTAGALREHGITARAPADARSEGLLALPALQEVAGQRVLLVTGEGGRGLLERALAERGATVTRLECYRRLADPDAGAKLDAFRDTRNEGIRSVVLVTSTDALQNLLNAASWLRAQPLPVLCAGDRIAEAARAAGLTRVVAAGGADDESLFSALTMLARNPAGETRT